MSSFVLGLAHIGIRVHDLARSRAFYEKLGFEFAWGPAGPEPVAAMRHPGGLELNFILNAPAVREPNVLMDVPQKHEGVTHFALRISNVAAAETTLTKAGIALSGRRADVAIFVRDPDGNVIEFATD